MAYNPSDWYWLKSTGEVFSSASNGLVSASDAAYGAWKAAGNSPTPWPKDDMGVQTSSALDGVLVGVGLPASGLTPPPSAQLLAYAAAKRDAIADGGITFNAGNSSAPITIKADTSASGKANLSGILTAYALGVQTGEYTWYQSGGAVSLTQAQLQATSVAVFAFVAEAYATWQAVDNAVIAGTITTFAEIDTPASPISAWPVNS